MQKYRYLNKRDLVEKVNSEMCLYILEPKKTSKDQRKIFPNTSFGRRVCAPKRLFAYIFAFTTCTPLVISWKPRSSINQMMSCGKEANRSEQGQRYKVDRNPTTIRTSSWHSVWKISKIFIIPKVHYRFVRVLEIALVTSGDKTMVLVRRSTHDEHFRIVEIERLNGKDTKSI